MNGKNFTKHTLQILVSIGINYPVLREDFVVLQKPLLIVTGERNLEKAAGILSDSGTPRLDEYLSAKKLMAVLNDVNSDFVLYKFVQSKKGIVFLDMIAGAVTSGSIGGERFNALPAVISEKMPYACNTDRFLPSALTVSMIYLLKGFVLYRLKMSFQLCLISSSRKQQVQQMRKVLFWQQPVSIIPTLGIMALKKNLQTWQAVQKSLLNLMKIYLMPAV